MSKKNTILRHATTLFARQGFSATSMTEISQRSSVASATIFYHFATKEVLLLAILTRVKEVVLNNFKQYEETHCFENGLEAVQGALTYYLGLSTELEDEFLLLHRHFPYQLAEVNPDCRHQLLDIYNCLVDLIEKAIVTGQRDGTIGPLSAHKTALILFSTVDGMVRLNSYNLYEAGTLYQDLMACCGRILKVV